MAAPSWIQAVKNQANERLFLTGNQLLPEGLDAHAAIGTRVELTYTLVIEDVEGTTTIVLNPLRSNGVEAGWLMNDYEGQRRRLERTTNKFLATLRRLDTAGSNQRSDSVLGAAVGGLQARARIWAIVTDRAALTRNRRWNDLATRSSARVKEAKRLEQAQVLGVLTIDDAAVERRLRHDIMGQPEPLDPATGGSFRTAELTEPFDPEGRPNRAITAFDRSALDAYRTETRLSYLRAWGLRDKTVIDFVTPRPCGCTTMCTRRSPWARPPTATPGDCWAGRCGRPTRAPTLPLPRPARCAPCRSTPPSRAASARSLARPPCWR